MTDKKILEGNRIIAEFVGGKFANEKESSYMNFRPVDFGGMSGSYGCYLEECLFHKSWDWLIPACDKWDRIKLNTIKHIHPSEWNRLNSLTEQLESKVIKYKIEPVFAQLVKNIEWYNQNKK